ncbi:MAG: hypothetical protein MUC56_04070 [Thermoanaerobaculales bacterium]|jgi:hypothetical protein|nr:hypothetical protein [Thermoanaerobaculales bacterium]
MRLLTWTLALVVGLGPAATEAAEPFSRRDDEAASILERIRLYRERHGIAAERGGEQLLERARWGYERWLAAEHRRSAGGGAAGTGWVSLGPGNGAGRMTALAPHPVDDGTLVAGAASGGLWKTDDHGGTWRPLTDGLSDLSVGAVAYAPSDPEVVYLGSGEGGLGSFFVPGIGLLRSDDGGESWFLPQPGEIVAEQFFALSVDPRDPERVLAATERGLLATDDGGLSWSEPLGHPDLLGVTDVVRSAADPDRLWAALWCFSRCPDGLARVMISGDGGASWAPAAGGLPDALLNNPNANRIALAVAPSDDRVLYAALNTSHYTPQGPAVAIYRSTDRGASWSATADPGAYLLFQGWYDNAITVDPEDPDTVVAAGVWYVRTTNGGASWTTMDPIAAGDWMGTPTLPHVDGHAFAWQGGALWLGCDGGVWVSADRGSTWSGRNSGLVTRQFYGLDIDPIRRDRLIGGTQDNKTNLRLGPGAEDWEWVLDGDGFESAVNPLVPDLVYGTIYGTLVFRSFDGGSSWLDVSPPTGGDPTPFATPLTMRPDLPWQLFTGSSRVWRSDDAGATWLALPTEVVGGGWSFDVVRAVAVTPADHQRIVIGKGAAVLASHDGGSTWRETPTAAFVNSVALSPVAADLVLAGTARPAADEPQLLRSSDGGLTWTGATAGLPPFAVQALAWHPSDPATAFAGTDVGLYRSTDGASSWSPVGDGLPAVSVHDLVVADDGSRVVVATHGRGIWELALADPVGAPPVVTLDGPTEVFIGDPAAFPATAVDPDGGSLDLRFLASDDWRLVPGAAGASSIGATFVRVFDAAAEVLVAANAVDSDGRAGFGSRVVRVYEPGDDCSTPRLIPGGGPFPYTVLTENRSATIAASDPPVPCTSFPGDPDSGRYASIWLEFTPAESGLYTFSSCGSTPDTALSAWTGPACGPYQALAGACSDDDRLVRCTGRDTDSWLSLDLAAGVTIRVLLGTTEDIEVGNLRLTVDCPSCRPPPSSSTLVIPAAARTAGDAGTLWTTTLELVNPGTAPVAADVELLPGPGTAAATVRRTVAGGATLAIEDVVLELLGGRGLGALRVASATPLVATTRTATTGDGGSYGQGIPARPAADAASDGDAIRLFGFGDPADLRTNLGLVNPGSDEVSLVVRVYDAEAEVLGEHNETLSGSSWLQLNRVLETLGVAADAALAVVRQTSASGRFSAYASVVDERTGDPTFLGPTGVGRVSDPLWIPAVAHAVGAGGARWRTDLTLVNPGSGDLIVEIDLIGEDGPVATDVVHVPDGWVIRLPDVVADALAADGTGALRLTPRQGLVMATSRTFAATPGGTYGQGIPGVPASTALATGEVAVLPGLRQDSRFRTNLGLVNIGEAALEATVVAHAADGETLATLSFTVAAASRLQANQPLPAGTAFATVSSATPGARLLAYASVVDRATDDPTYVAAVPAGD